MSVPDDSDCRSLWLAVIRTAVEDRDRAWFTLANADFRTVCWLANVAPEYVLRMAEARLQTERKRKDPIISQRGKARVAA